MNPYAVNVESKITTDEEYAKESKLGANTTKQLNCQAIMALEIAKALASNSGLDLTERAIAASACVIADNLMKEFEEREWFFEFPGFEELDKSNNKG